jgi:hypothetical protein
MNSFLLDCVIKVSIVLLAALIAVRLLRRRSAALRHSVLSAALVCAALLPAFNLLLPPLNVSIPGRPTPQIPALVPDEATDDAPDNPLADSEFPAGRRAPVAHGAVIAGPAIASVAASPDEPDAISTFRQVAPSIWMTWLTGALLGFAMIAAGIARLVWLGARAERIAALDWLGLANGIAREYGLWRPLRVLRSRNRSLLAVAAADSAKHTAAL